MGQWAHLLLRLWRVLQRGSGSVAFKAASLLLPLELWLMWEDRCRIYSITSVGPQGQIEIFQTSKLGGRGPWWIGLRLVCGPGGQVGPIGAKVGFPHKLLRYFDQMLVFIVQVPGGNKIPNDWKYSLPATFEFIPSCCWIFCNQAN